LDRVRLVKEANEQVQQVTSNAISGTLSTSVPSYEVLLPTALVMTQFAEVFIPSIASLKNEEHTTLWQAI